MAIKYMLTNNMNQNNIKAFIREIQVLIQLNYSHKKLVQFYGALIDSSLAIVMEFCQGGSIFELLHTSDVPISHT